MAILQPGARRRRPRRRLAAAGGALCIAAAAVAAVVIIRHFQPRAPAAAGGHSVQLVASGLKIPTSFAFGPAGAVFAGDASGDTTNATGGVFLLRNGSARRLPGVTAVVSGVVWHDGKLYISAGRQLLAWSGWTGTTFTKRTVLYTGPPRFSGFDGLAFGADGRIYAGVEATTDDHGPTTLPYARDILSFTATGKDLKVFARGIRQPWQLAFPPGSSSPFVSDLGQDAGTTLTDIPDFVLRVHGGQNYGFPRCNWTIPCAHADRPLKFFPAHTDPMGLAVMGNRVYIAEYGDVHPPAVVSMPLAGGPTTPLLTHFEELVVGLAAHDGWLYVGDIDGNVFRVRP